MENIKAFLKRKNIEISVNRYLIGALGAMAQGLFCSLLIGTILNTIGAQFQISCLTDIVATAGGVSYTVGGLASAMSGPAMAVAIGYALHCPPLVLFSLISVGFATNALGGAGGPLAVLFVAIIAAECGKAISKETRIDILVTPLVTIGIGIALAALIAPGLGRLAMHIGDLIMWATELHPFLMGVAVSVLVGIALTLPISSAAICAAFGLTGLAGGAAVAGCCAQMVGFAVMSYKENRIGGLISQGIGTYNKLKKHLKRIPLTRKQKLKLMNEFKSIILDRSFPKIKGVLLTYLKNANIDIIYSYKKISGNLKQEKKEKIYLKLLKNIIYHINDDIVLVTFDSFNNPRLNSKIEKEIKELNNVKEVLFS